MKRILLLFSFLIIKGSVFSQNMILPESSIFPNKSQKEQIKRKYGMFIHFGVNTFHNEEWTDGSKPASSYAPAMIDADQWIRSAKDAGMRYVILITKHHDGFCLWDSKFTEYDVASSQNTTNVVEAVAKACKKYGIELGLYYSLWDRKVNGDVDDWMKDSEYNKYMLNQISELIDMVENHTEIVEFWFDGGWVKQNYRWPIMDLYQTIKERMPHCQIGVNWSIGSPENVDKHPVLPQDQKEGFPIRYWPSDFRLGDPYLPSDNDPKIFVHDGKTYYMPWESTVCISKRWFYNTDDKDFKSVDELEKLFLQSTKNDNILILNCPPNRDGKLRNEDIVILKSLYERIKYHL